MILRGSEIQSGPCGLMCFLSGAITGISIICNKCVEFYFPCEALTKRKRAGSSTALVKPNKKAQL